MGLNDQSNYYDVLDLKPDASPQEIREAYLKTKSAFNKDSVALYTLIGSAEREDTLRTVEEAYEVLSNPDRRKKYDANHGILDPEAEIFTTRAPRNKKIISIDRVPPMEISSGAEDLLIPPSTDFASSPEPSQSEKKTMGASTSSFNSFSPFQSEPSVNIRLEGTGSMNVPPSFQIATATPAPTPPSSENREPVIRVEPLSLEQEIEQETEWKGLFIRKVREFRRVSIEEMSNNTKISKTYLLAIEEENFAKLPAAVFVRGFVIQVARVLRLSHQKVAAAYMARFYQANSRKP